jgi:hypothetical protein
VGSGCYVRGGFAGVALLAGVLFGPSVAPVEAQSKPAPMSWVLTVTVQETDIDGSVTGEVGKPYFVSFTQFGFGSKDAAQTMAEYYGNNGVHLPFEDPVRVDSPSWYYPPTKIHRILSRPLTP